MGFLMSMLILGASADARPRVVESKHSIVAILGGIVLGAADDLLSKEREIGDFLDGTWGIRNVELRIDGKRREGFRSWAEAGGKIFSFILDRGRGSIEYAYELLLPRYLVRRSTRVEDDRLLLITEASWVERVPIELPRRTIYRFVSISVKFIISGEEGGLTLLKGSASGTADLSDFSCCIVRGFASRRASSALQKELTEALLSIEIKGRTWFSSRELEASLADIGLAVSKVLRRRLSR